MEIYGLVLAGGRSRRMGEDKGSLYYHSKNQVDHCILLLRNYCQKVFVSCRKNQRFEGNQAEGILWDLGQGPAAGLRQAHQCFPSHHWLTLPCDMPDILESHLQALAKDPGSEARCFQNPQGFWEPLLALWTPAAMKHLAEENSPREALKKSIITVLSHPPVPSDIDTPAERIHRQTVGAPNSLA